MACKVIDWVIQSFGGGGTNNDVGVASAYATARMLRLADGPDEVHRNQIAKIELGEQTSVVEALAKAKQR
jgi:acyl-CoA dehydrogenase